MRLNWALMVPPAASSTADTACILAFASSSTSVMRSVIGSGGIGFLLPLLNRDLPCASGGVGGFPGTFLAMRLNQPLIPIERPQRVGVVSVGSSEAFGF